MSAPQSGPILITNGQVVNADGIQNADVLIENGIINKISSNLQAPPGTRLINASGKYLVPGGIDPHTHFELEFMGTVSVDDFYRGTRAAVAGGTTTISKLIIMLNNLTF